MTPYLPPCVRVLSAVLLSGCTVPISSALPMEQSIVSVKKNHSIKKIRTVNGADFFICVWQIIKNRLPKGKRFFTLQLNSAGNFTGTQATGAGVDITGRTVHHRFHSFYVGFPCAVCTSVRMGNLNSKGNTFTAAITFCHLLHLLFSSR